MKLTEKLENLEFYAIAASKYLNNTLKSSTIKKYSKEIKEALITLEIIKELFKEMGLRFIFSDDNLVLITDDNEFEHWHKCKTKEECELLKEVLL